MLVDAVIIAGDGAGTHVDSRTNLTIPHVAQMIDFAAAGNLGLFEFHEIAHVDRLRQLRIRSNAGKGSDTTPFTNFGTLDKTIGVNTGTCANAAIAAPSWR
jgi:hypothetical protein